MTVYDYDYVNDHVPDVEEGDQVEVAYVSKQTSEQKTRTGEVIDVHANGFTLDCGRDEYATGVRVHEYGKGAVRISVSTLHLLTEGEWVHSTHLNKRHNGVDQVDVNLAN